MAICVGTSVQATEPPSPSYQKTLASANSPLLDVFPRSTARVPDDRRGETTFLRRFTPSGSQWDERLDESRVFQLEMRHRQDRDHSFKLRVGKGGQIYSLRGLFGESVPPSWRPQGRHLSPWNDEVWQFVAVCTKYNGLTPLLRAGAVPASVRSRIEASPYALGFFVHNSGAYIPHGAKINSLYCPLLALGTLDDARCIRMLNWGLIPQIKTVHRSPLLYYTQIRDVGNGVIELTWVVHNFSVRDDIVFDHLNAPWGGTRISSLPERYVSTPSGELVGRKEILGKSGVVSVLRTGGWNLSCASAQDNAPALALVFGRDKNWEAEQQRAAAGQAYAQFAPSLYRDWRASAPAYERGAWRDWRTRPENSFRNYDVCEVIPKLRIAPGTSIWYRSFLVAGRKPDAVRQAKALVEYVDYGLRHFSAKTTPMVELASPRAGAPSEVLSASQPVCRVFARPVPGSMPLFLVEQRSSHRKIVTTDPYYFVKKEKVDFDVPPSHPFHDYYSHAVGYTMSEHNSRWHSLIGYAYVDRPAGGEWRRLSSMLDAASFPKPAGFHLDLWVKADGGDD